MRARKRCTVFDTKKESLEGEKKGMRNFVNGKGVVKS
jgi:hypothetical protein